MPEMMGMCNRFALTSRLQHVSPGEIFHKSAETDLRKGSLILVVKNRLGAMKGKWEAFVERMLMSKSNFNVCKKGTADSDPNPFLLECGTC